jgi:hypothetical protein
MFSNVPRLPTSSSSCSTIREEPDEDRFEDDDQDEEEDENDDEK